MGLLCQGPCDFFVARRGAVYGFTLAPRTPAHRHGVLSEDGLTPTSGGMKRNPRSGLAAWEIGNWHAHKRWTELEPARWLGVIVQFVLLGELCAFLEGTF
ncbi:hypothetical protein GUJ93_ZPchr0003g17821 [Zizania palustris]|uniref:Uncharacterized protein n=1 Tax=Zizania palustris TaxID=103762 RepID=A0A8J5VY43_ZIZPA|nr:hypothetical protein GUJ93_ZPchr0003g17821 [Zizania palustris]KAG8063755.1 hypothetical protein GUJ93_ZPchr0003g17821 [Zizania palustris]